MENEKQRWQLLKSRNQGDYRVFQLNIHTMRSTRSGVEGDYVALDCPSACNVIAVTEDRQVVMVRQYRFGLGQDTLEFPAGMLDPQEDPLRAAQRELLEETGFGDGEWVYLGYQVINAAIQNNVIHSFYAGDVRLVDVQKLDHDEDIDVILYPFEELRALIANGQIDQAVMLSTIFRYEMWRNSLA